MTLHPIPAARHPCDDRPEVALIALAKDGDETAIRELVRRCNQQLFRVTRSIVHDDAEAEDVVQAVYVSAFTSLEKFRGEARFATWLTRMAMNEAYGRLRRQRHVVDLSDYRREVAVNESAGSTAMTPPPSPTPEAEYGRAEARRFLERAIDALPEPFRLTYVLRDVQGMTAREAATVLGISQVTVKTRLFRARRRLRDEIRQHLAAEFSGVFPFDGARCAGMADRVIARLRRASV